jgi:hypothetical protein
MLGIDPSSTGFNASSQEVSPHQPSNSEGWNENERALLHTAISTRQPFLDFAFSRINSNGSLQHFRVSGEPIFDEVCRFIGYRGIGIACKAMPSSTPMSLSEQKQG